MSGDIEVRQVVLAGLVRRAAARLIDALCMLMLCALTGLAAGIALAILAVGGQIDPIFGTEGAELAVLLVVSMVVLAVVLVYRYESVATARRGQTLAKRGFSIAVVSFPYRGEQGLSRRRSRIRWAVPHGAFMVAGSAGMASSAALGVWGLVVGAGAAAAGWTAVYASVLLDDDRRGWHDKLAGTVVVTVGDDGVQPLFAEPDADERRSEPERAPAAGSPRRLRKAVGAARVALVTAAAAAAVSSCAYLLLSASGSLGIEEPDDTGTRPDFQGGNYRKVSNPDGDLCWREEDSDVYYCDLVSIGGLQWDTGDLGYATRRAVHLGSGMLCVMSEGGVRCWEWSPAVQPRPARTPDGAEFHLLSWAMEASCAGRLVGFVVAMVGRLCDGGLLDGGRRPAELPAGHPPVPSGCRAGRRAAMEQRARNSLVVPARIWGPLSEPAGWAFVAVVAVAGSLGLAGLNGGPQALGRGRR